MSIIMSTLITLAFLKKATYIPNAQNFGISMTEKKKKRKQYIIDGCTFIFMIFILNVPNGLCRCFYANLIVTDYESILIRVADFFRFLIHRTFFGTLYKVNSSIQKEVKQFFFRFWGSKVKDLNLRGSYLELN